MIEWIRPYLSQCDLGIDLNASTGWSIFNHSQISSLNYEDGSFLTSRENRALDTNENGMNHVNYEELYMKLRHRFNGS